MPLRDLILETIDLDLQLTELALGAELFALEGEELRGEPLVADGLLAPEPEHRELLRRLGVAERVGIGRPLELLERRDRSGRALQGELGALLGEPVPGRELLLPLQRLADRDLIDLIGRRALALLVGDLIANDGELALERDHRRPALLELEPLGPGIELDQQVAFLDVHVEVEVRKDDPTRAGWLEAVDRIVGFDPALPADLHDRHLGHRSPRDEPANSQHHEDDEQHACARLVSVQRTKRSLEWVGHWDRAFVYARENLPATHHSTRTLIKRRESRGKISNRSDTSNSTRRVTQIPDCLDSSRNAKHHHHWQTRSSPHQYHWHAQKSPHRYHCHPLAYHEIPISKSVRDVRRTTARSSTHQCSVNHGQFLRNRL